MKTGFLRELRQPPSFDRNARTIELPLDGGPPHRPPRGGSRFTPTRLRAQATAPSPIEPVGTAAPAHGSIGSERSFGFVMAAVFALVALWPLVGDDEARWWSLGVSAAFAGLAVLRAHWLRPLNQLWFRFGLLLQKIVSPVILGVLFFAVVTPIAATMRLLRRDVLGLRFDRDATSYWIDRSSAKPGPMQRQF